MKVAIILAVVMCVMVAHVQSQGAGNTNQRQVMKARQLAAAQSGNGLGSVLPMLAMSKGKMNPALLTALMSRGGRGGMGNMLPYYLMAEGGLGEGMLPMMALMNSQGGASSGGSAGSNNLLNMMLFGGMLN